MARALTFDLDQISNGNATKRQPAWSVTVWDIRSGLNTVSDVITGLPLDIVTGPFDISEFAEVVRVNERSGDYVTSGVPSSIIGGTVTDPDGQFNPDLIIPLVIGTQAYTDNRSRFFRRGNLIRITIGDERVDESTWVDVFTGRFAGQVGYVRGRAPNESQLTFKAYGREASFLQYERTSDEFTALPATTYIDMANSVATFEMGLSSGEVDFSGFGTNLLRHASVTLAKENPMSMLAKIMLFDVLLPKFNGSGILTTTDGTVQAASDRFYDDDSAIISINRPLTEVQPPDAVCVVGLDFNLTRINQPRQVIATMNITTGYFTSNESLKVFWSDDKTMLADNVVGVVLKSVNGGLSALGGGESFVAIASPTQDPSFPGPIGTIGMTVTIDTGYAPWLGVFLLITYIILSAIPNISFPFGGATIQVGSILAAIALAGALMVMTKLGRGQYEFQGDPFEFVFEEIRRCAADAGTNEFDRNEVTVLNHLIDNETTADNVAMELFFRQAARGRPRAARMLHDLALEPDDTFELISDGRRFLVDSIGYELRRKSPTLVIADVKCFEITDNISRAT